MDDKKLVCKADYEAARARGTHTLTTEQYASVGVMNQ